MILTSGDICTRLFNTNRDMFNPIFAHPFSYRICSIELCITREVNFPNIVQHIESHISMVTIL